MQTAVNDHGNDTQYIFNGIFHILFDLNLTFQYHFAENRYFTRFLFKS